VQAVNKARASGNNTLRIIAGLWRGRRLGFPDVPGLRPTPDRVRETVFNWLQAWVAAEDCLDLYAGSGACGFEALSRGARSVVFVDASKAAVQAINVSLAMLQSTPGYGGQASVELARAEHWLAAAALRGGAGFGLVFLDPPFADGVLVERCRQLEHSGLLKPRAHIYVESGEPLPIPGLTELFPHNWRQLKSARAGAVFFGLYQRCED
jgi:16S rRNA (guanine966-N2)-methyltransferase